MKKNNLLITGFISLLGLITISCGDDEEQINTPIQPDECVTSSGNFPRYIDMPPTGDNGAYDPTLAGDPETGRVWMVFSRVDGPGGAGKVSTHLGYSDDNGKSWCYKNQINPSEDVPINELPQEFQNTAVSAHWSHEVPSIAYVPNAPENEKWQMTWHRYLHVSDGVQGNDDRQFAYGWIAMKKASNPELFASNPEIKLFSSQGYYKDAATENYNNSIGGTPQLRIHDLHPDLSNTAVLTESGMHVFNGDLYMSLLKGDLVSGNGIILLKKPLSGNWEYLSTLLKSEDALALNSSWTSFSATDLFSIDTINYLLVSPVSDIYEGLALFVLDLDNNLLIDSDGDGPDLIWELPKTSGSNIFQSGVGTYDELCFESGILFGDAVVDSPQFRIYASGYIPE